MLCRWVLQQGHTLAQRRALATGEWIATSVCREVPHRQVVDTLLRTEKVEFFLRPHGLWAGIIALLRPPPPPFDIETMEPLRPSWRSIKEWIPVENPDDDPAWIDQTTPWKAPQVSIGDDRILVFEFN